MKLTLTLAILTALCNQLGAGGLTETMWLVTGLTASISFQRATTAS